MNKVGSESLNLTVAKAAENIIDTKGVSGKQPEFGVEVCLQRLESGHRCKRWALRLCSFLLFAEGLLRCDSGSRRDMRHHPVLVKERRRAWEGRCASPALGQGSPVLCSDYSGARISVTLV